MSDCSIARPRCRHLQRAVQGQKPRASEEGRSICAHSGATGPGFRRLSLRRRGRAWPDLHGPFTRVLDPLPTHQPSRLDSVVLLPGVDSKYQSITRPLQFRIKPGFVKE